MWVVLPVAVGIARQSLGRVGEHFADDDVGGGEGWEREQRQQDEVPVSEAEYDLRYWQNSGQSD